MSFYSEKWIKKTRKPHRCIWCDEMIPAGSTTCYSSGTWHGDFYANHLHPECAAARDANLAENGEWESGGDYARGRQDDKRELPPEFAASYRGTSNIKWTVQ
jgi:hypothetical protein